MAYSILYRVILKIGGFGLNYLGDKRNKIGENPYPRRSIVALSIINVQELWRYWIGSRPSKSQIRSTRILKNSKANRTALILGNGPSLNRLNIIKVNQDCPDIWVVNNFYKLDWAHDLNFTHYVITDPEHILLDSDGRNEQLENVLKLVKEKSASLILPHWAVQLELLKKIKDLKVLYLDDRQLSAWSKNTSPIKARGYLSITLYKALGFTIFLGYSNIFVLGMDNTLFKFHASDFNNRILHKNLDYAYSENMVWDYSSSFLDGMAGAFTMYSHLIGDLSKFRGPILNLDSNSLTTAFAKTLEHPWIFTSRDEI